MTEKQKLAEALNPSFVVELPPNTKSVKYNVPMAMMPLSDWEKIEAAITPCEGERAAMAAEVERLRGALDKTLKAYIDVMSSHYDYPDDPWIDRPNKVLDEARAALAGGKEG